MTLNDTLIGLIEEISLTKPGRELSYLCSQNGLVASFSVHATKETPDDMVVDMLQSEAKRVARILEDDEPGPIAWG
jgi:hypothetical protein